MQGPPVGTNLSFFFDLPQNNPDIDAFESPLSLATDFESLNCVTKMC